MQIMKPKHSLVQELHWTYRLYFGW